MSERDRQIWDERYAEGAFTGRYRPNVFLQRVLARWPLPANPRALDLACGSGRNALFLAAELGASVLAVDVSGEGLARGRQQARRVGVEVEWRQADLESGLPAGLAARPFDLIVQLRYVNTALGRQALSCLAPDGLFVTEQHLRWPGPVAGPRRDAFRVAPGELRPLGAGHRVLHYDEGRHEDPDGEPVALCRLVVRRLSPVHSQDYETSVVS